MGHRNLKQEQAAPSQPSNNEQMGQRKLLGGAAGETAKNQQERPYERRVSKPIVALFPNSYSSVDCFIQDKKRMCLSAVHIVGRTLLNAVNYVPGDYKFLFKPASGGKTAFLFESLVHKDLVGLMLMQGEHNGQEVRVLEMRYKKKTSMAQKGVELELGEPHMKAEMSGVTVGDAIAGLNDVLGDPGVDLKKKERLSAELSSALEAERYGQESMFAEACSNNAETVAKARALLGEISSGVNALNNAKRHLSEAEIAPGADSAENEAAGAIQKAKALISSLTGDKDSKDRKISIGAYVGALDAWPFQASEGKDGAPGEAFPEAFYDSLSQGSRSMLGYISKEYVTDVLPNVAGVAILEHTAIDSISQLQNLLRLIHSKTPPDREGPLLGKMLEMDARFVSLYGMVKGISRELNEISLHKGQYSSKQWFLKLCGFVEARRGMLAELRALEKTVDGLEHDAPYRTQAKKIITNMAFNLCRVDKGEHQLLGSYLENKAVHAELRGAQAFKSGRMGGMHDRMASFIAAARQESERAGQYLPDSKSAQERSDSPSRKRFKDGKAQADEKIYAKILELQALAPALGDILLSDYRRSKSHVSYKQGEVISESPENHLTRMRIAQRLYELTGDERYATAVEKYLDDASRLFALVWSSHRSRGRIIDTVKPICYLQEKGFDIVGAPEKHIRNGNTQPELSVEYRLIFEQGNASLVFSFDGKEHSLNANEASPYDTNRLPFDMGELEKNIHIDIYGERVSLVDIMPPGTGKNAYDMFRGIYLTASANPEKFEEIRADMAGKNMENARFLSTLATSKHRHSGNMAKFGDVLVENLPLKINANGTNSFETYLKNPVHYPDFEQSSAEAKEFALQQIARRLVVSLAVNKWDFVKEYIQGVLAEKG